MALPRSGIPVADPAPQDATVDDLTAATLTVTGASTLAAVTATSVAAPHSGLTGVTADQHHAQSHGHTGADGSGTVAHSATTGQTANDHHAQAHAVDGADHVASGLTPGHVLRATGATTFAFGALADSDVPATIARDAEVATAVSDHAALADPHTGYQKESEKAAASGYASLDASTKVPIAQIPTGSTSSTVPLGDHTHAAIGARVRRTTTQSIPNASSTAVTFDAERFDPNGFHDNVTNNSRLTVPTGLGGVYLITFSGQWGLSATGRRQFELKVNGVTTIALDTDVSTADANVPNRATLATVYQLVPTDYVEVYAYQDSGGALDLNAAGNFSPEFSIARLGT